MTTALLCIPCIAGSLVLVIALIFVGLPFAEFKVLDALFKPGKGDRE